jgi:hypothetical protein
VIYLFSYWFDADYYCRYRSRLGHRLPFELGFEVGQTVEVDHIGTFSVFSILSVGLDQQLISNIVPVRNFSISLYL